MCQRSPVWLTGSRSSGDVVVAGTGRVVHVEERVDLERIEPGQLNLVAKIDQALQLGLEQSLRP